MEEALKVGDDAGAADQDGVRGAGEGFEGEAGGGGMLAICHDGWLRGITGLSGALDSLGEVVGAEEPENRRELGLGARWEVLQEKTVG